MTHPMLTRLVTQPHLLGNHADAYAQLLSAELATATAELKRQTRLGLAVACGWVVSAVLAGVSLMLLGVIPQSAMPAAWVLLVVPLLPVMAALGYQIRLNRTTRTPPFGATRQQIKADIALLREASAR